MNQKDPYSANALGDVIADILWARTYIASFLRKYPELLKLGCNSEASATDPKPRPATFSNSRRE